MVIRIPNHCEINPLMTASIELSTVCCVKMTSSPRGLTFTICVAPTSQDSNAENKIAVERPPSTRPRTNIQKFEPCAVNKQHREYKILVVWVIIKGRRKILAQINKTTSALFQRHPISFKVLYIRPISFENACELYFCLLALKFSAYTLYII